MAVFLFSLLVFLALCPGDHSADWSLDPKENDVIYACANGTLTLPWNLSMDTGDVIVDKQWFYTGRSEIMIAMVAHDNFLAMPAFSGRVHQMGTAGLSIEQVQVLDSGNYTVEVVVRTAGGNVVTLRRSVNVLITDGLQTTDGHLHVRELPVAEYSMSTKQYHVVLGCGTFTYPTLPPVRAIWFTPSGTTLNSSSYHDNSFRLLVPNPVEGGSYTCHLPASLTCVHGVSPQATHVLYEMKARFAVMEARQMDMEKELRKHISFHARLSSDTHLPTSGTPVILSNVINNQGDAYDATSGSFIAPYNGTYCFLATATTNGNAYAMFYLMVDNRDVGYLYAFLSSGPNHDSASVHAVVHLTLGQRVWLKTQYSNSYYTAKSTSFSGFLISPDS